METELYGLRPEQILVDCVVDYLNDTYQGYPALYVASITRLARLEGEDGKPKDASLCHPRGVPMIVAAVGYAGDDDFQGKQKFKENLVKAIFREAYRHMYPDANEEDAVAFSAAEYEPFNVWVDRHGIYDRYALKEVIRKITNGKGVLLREFTEFKDSPQNPADKVFIFDDGTGRKIRTIISITKNDETGEYDVKPGKSYPYTVKGKTPWITHVMAQYECE